MEQLQANYVVNFSPEAVQLFELQENTSLRNKLYNMVIHFRSLPAITASKILFSLYYADSMTRKKVIDRFFFKSENLSALESPEKNPDESILYSDKEHANVLAQELLDQYSATYPDFLVVRDVPEYEKELRALRKAMENQPVLFFRAVEQCKLVCHVESIVTLSLNYLTSKDKTFQMRGLEAIGHNFQHRLLLRPYARKIGVLLQAMHNAKTRDNLMSPFASWLAQLEEKDFSSSYSFVEANDLPKHLLLDELLKFIENKSDIILNLPRSEELKKCLQNAEVDLNTFIDKEEYLLLVKAIVTLLYDKEAESEAQSGFSIGNMESLLAYHNATKAFEKAQECYNDALDKFIASC